MPNSIADWAILGGVLTWDAGIVGLIVWRVWSDRPTWTRRVRAPEVVVKERITRDWRPLI